MKPTISIQSGVRHVRTSRRLGAALLLGTLVLISAGCASTPAGINGHDAFERESNAATAVGSTPFAKAAQCFEEQARFLPLSEFSRDGSAAAFTYRLRFGGLWFEQVRISATPSGSQAEWRLAPNLDAKWQAQFEQDRIAPLKRCLGA